MRIRNEIGLLIGLALVIGFLGSDAGAAEVSGWRNDGSGSYPDADIPLEWAEDKNIVWKIPLDSWSNGGPVLVGDRLFVCSEPTTLVCVNAQDGQVLWQKDNHYFDSLTPEQAAQARANLTQADKLKQQIKSLQDEINTLKGRLEAAADKDGINRRIAAQEARAEKLQAKIESLAPYRAPGTHGTNGHSSPTPTTDGKFIYVLFGTGVVACYDLDGNRQWIKFVQAPTHGWGHSASPVLIGNRIVVHIRGLFALDQRNGEVLWQAESAPRWGSPVAAQIGSVDVVITAGGDVLRADDGQILAQAIAGLEFATPVVHSDTVYFVENGGKALKLPNQALPGMTPQVLWTTTPKKDRYYASIILHQGFIYAVSRKNQYSVIEAKTGEVVFEDELGLGSGTTYPSIVLAGASLLVSSDNGTTMILRPGPGINVLATNKIEPFRSSPLIRGRRMYIRGLKHLYCIGR